MTHKTYTGTLTDRHGHKFGATYLLTDDELQGMKKAGVLPDDIRPLIGIKSISDQAVARITADYEIERIMAQNMEMKSPTEKSQTEAKIVHLVIIFWWMSGFFFVKGFWLSVLAVVFPPYPMYLFVEYVLKATGMLP